MCRTGLVFAEHPAAGEATAGRGVTRNQGGARDRAVDLVVRRSDPAIEKGAEDAAELDQIHT